MLAKIPAQVNRLLSGLWFTSRGLQSLWPMRFSSVRSERSADCMGQFTVHKVALTFLGVEHETSFRYRDVCALDKGCATALAGLPRLCDFAPRRVLPLRASVVAERRAGLPRYLSALSAALQERSGLVGRRDASGCVARLLGLLQMPEDAVERAAAGRIVAAARGWLARRALRVRELPRPEPAAESVLVWTRARPGWRVDAYRRVGARSRGPPSAWQPSAWRPPSPVRRRVRIAATEAELRALDASEAQDAAARAEAALGPSPPVFAPGPLLFAEMQAVEAERREIALLEAAATLRAVAPECIVLAEGYEGLRDRVRALPIRAY